MSGRSRSESAKRRMFERISSSLRDPISDFAGGPLPHTILSAMQGTLVGLLPPKAQAALRATAKNARNAVNSVRLDLGDRALQSRTSLQAWRERFPNARKVVLRGRKITDDDMQYLVGVPIVTMYICHCRAVTPAGWACLEGVQELNIPGCKGITDDTFARLKGIQSLDMTDCNDVTDKAFAQLVGIKHLNMSECQQSITDAAFAHLKGIQSLDMSYCRQPTITDKAFARLAGIQSLNMSGCDQRTITDAAFVPLMGIQSLDMSYCGQDTITDAAFAPLAGIKELTIQGCEQFTGDGLELLGCELKSLYIAGTSDSLIDKAGELYGVTRIEPDVRRDSPSCGGSRGGGKSRSKKRRQKGSTRKFHF